MTRERIPIPTLRGSDCFACGSNNPLGLKMQFYCQGNKVCSDVVVEQHHVGWQNMVHGGIISTLLDEIMSWTVLYFRKVFAVTRQIKVKYLRPTPVGTPLTVQGEILGETEKKAIHTSGVLLDSRGKKLARSEAEFVILTGSRLEVLPLESRQEMELLFKHINKLQRQIKTGASSSP
ncbi:MAG: PaaI family thioesterase [Deltaproteobacteria bacterium]|nr:PaaI family thioesterase [Deltaproteobacteria bacterium]MBW2071891.1 PaaI family thioesterase [Deltaproteobacteria bacterium]